MDLNWFESLMYGVLSGLTDVLPVSAQAHKVLMLRFFGIKEDMALLDFLIHGAIFVGLYFCNQSQLIRYSRARALAKVPKRKRRRPLDVRSLMDLSMLRTMLIPVAIALLLYQYVLDLKNNFMVLSVFIFINGLMLYVPQFLPGSNRDSRTLTPVEGLLMGLGGGLSVLPGIFPIGAAVSIGSVCGMDRSFSLTMALLMQMVLTIGMMIYDIVAMSAAGLGTLSFIIIIRYLLTAASAFAATVLAVKLMRYLAENKGYSIFAFYCFGQALFTFILNLMT